MGFPVCVKSARIEYLENFNMKHKVNLLELLERCGSRKSKSPHVGVWRSAFANVQNVPRVSPEKSVFVRAHWRRKRVEK